MLTILLVEDNPGDARLLQLAIDEVAGGTVTVTHVERLAEALAQLACEPYDLVLLDLQLPDSDDLGTLQRLRAQARQTAVVVLTGMRDDALGIQAVQFGAQDYLVKGQADGASIMRAVRYAIERQRLQDELRALSLVDELTGLHNRRGFLALAAHQIAVADRSGRPLALLFADLDGLKHINDRLGHHLGDDALRHVGQILQSVCRTSDIVARLGGDEFVALLTDASPPDADAIVARIQAATAEVSRRSDATYSLAVSVGVACYDPNDQSCTLDELLARADRLMYARKRERRMDSPSPIPDGDQKQENY